MLKKNSIELTINGVECIFDKTRLVEGFPTLKKSIEGDFFAKDTSIEIDVGFAKDRVVELFIKTIYHNESVDTDVEFVLDVLLRDYLEVEHTIDTLIGIEGDFSCLLELNENILDKLFQRFSRPSFANQLLERNEKLNCIPYINWYGHGSRSEQKRYNPFVDRCLIHEDKNIYKREIKVDTKVERIETHNLTLQLPYNEFIEFLDTTTSNLFVHLTSINTNMVGTFLFYTMRGIKPPKHVPIELYAQSLPLERLVSLEEHYGEMVITKHNALFEVCYKNFEYKIIFREWTKYPIRLNAEFCYYFTANRTLKCEYPYLNFLKTGDLSLFTKSLSEYDIYDYLPYVGNLFATDAFVGFFFYASSTNLHTTLGERVNERVDSIDRAMRSLREDRSYFWNGKVFTHEKIISIILDNNAFVKFGQPAYCSNPVFIRHSDDCVGLPKFDRLLYHISKDTYNDLLTHMGVTDDLKIPENIETHLYFYNSLKKEWTVACEIQGVTEDLLVKEFELQQRIMEEEDLRDE